MTFNFIRPADKLLNTVEPDVLIELLPWNNSKVKKSIPAKIQVLQSSICYKSNTGFVRDIISNLKISSEFKRLRFYQLS